VGLLAAAGGTRGTALGWSAAAYQNNATALGEFAIGYGENSTGVGGEATAYGNHSIALGYQSGTSLDDTISIGSRSTAVFEGAVALEVDRSRFRPVKSTDDLLVLRSDVYEIGADGVVHSITDPPLVKLDPRHFKTIADFEARIPVAPSLRDANSFIVEGDWSLGSDVVVIGDVRLEDEGPGQRVPDGARLLG